MTGHDILKAGKAKTRNSSLLYTAYIELFEKAFGRKPECPTCGSAQGNKDWTDFTGYVYNNSPITTENQYIMLTTFTLRDKQKIYSYDYTHKNGRVLRARTWGHSMTEDFAVAYLENATDEKQLEERKAEFKILPLKFIQEEPKENLADLTKDQLKERLAGLEVDEKEYKSLKHPELVALLEATMLEKENSKDAGDAGDAGDAKSNDDLLD